MNEGNNMVVGVGESTQVKIGLTRLNVHSDFATTKKLRQDSYSVQLLKVKNS